MALRVNLCNAIYLFASMHHLWRLGIQISSLLRCHRAIEHQKVDMYSPLMGSLGINHFPRVIRTMMISNFLVVPSSFEHLRIF